MFKFSRSFLLLGVAALVAVAAVPTPAHGLALAHAIASDPTTTTPVSGGFLGTLLPIVVGALTFVGFEGLQKLVSVIDKLPATVKQIAVGVIAYGLTAGAGALGVHLSSTNIAGLTSQDLSTLISAGLAYAFHLGAQNAGTA